MKSWRKAATLAREEEAPQGLDKIGLIHSEGLSYTRRSIRRHTHRLLMTHLWTRALNFCSKAAMKQSTEEGQRAKL